MTRKTLLRVLGSTGCAMMKVFGRELRGLWYHNPISSLVATLSSTEYRTQCRLQVCITASTIQYGDSGEKIITKRNHRQRWNCSQNRPALQRRTANCQQLFVVRCFPLGATPNQLAPPPVVSNSSSHNHQRISEPHLESLQATVLLPLTLHSLPQSSSSPHNLASHHRPPT